MTKMPLRKHKFEQKQNTERPQTVAPTSRSKLRERPRCVAARGRSGLVLASPGGEFASDFFLSLWDVAPSFGSDFSTSLWKVAPRSKCVSPDVKTRATLCSRSGWVAPGCGAQRPHAVAPRGRSSSARPKLTLITSFWAPNALKCLQKLHVVLNYLIETYVCKMQPRHG